MIYITDKIQDNNLRLNILANNVMSNNNESSFGLTKKDNIISEDSTLVPMHIARVGEFKGYRDGEFELTQDIFNECITNFNSEGNPLPVYRGHADVMGSANGEEPPCCGWILALKTDDSGNLFALVELTEDIKEEIKAGKYKFTSIYMKSDEVHRESGEPIGCRLVSLALTNQPFIDNLQSIKLSNKITNETHIYLSKEIQKMKKSNKKVILQATAPTTDVNADEPSLESAKLAEDQVEKMQEGKVMQTESEKALAEIDPMTLIEDTKNAVAPEMSMEDFIKSLIEMFMKSHEETEVPEKEQAEEATKIAEEATLASDETETPAIEKTEEEAVATEDKKETQMSALSLSMNTVKTLNLQLSSAHKEIDSLKKELDKERTVVLSAIIDEAVSKGKILDIEKDSFIKLAKTDKSLFEEMLSIRNVKPSVILSRLVNQPSANLKERTIENKQMNLSDKEKKMLAGAKIKI